MTCGYPKPVAKDRGVCHGAPLRTRFRNPLDFTWISDFRMDFWISKWISGFQGDFRILFETAIILKIQLKKQLMIH